MSEAEKKMTAVSRLFVESGEKERLLQLIKTRLLDSGWNDNLDAYARETIATKNLNSCTVDELLHEVNDYGKSTVSESIKKELLEHLKKFLDQDLD